MVDFKSLKAASGKKSLETLTNELNKLNGGESKGGADDRFWTATVDKAGNGYAVIRFLPSPPNEDVPFVRMFDHGFQGPGGWYIENSLTTIGKNDPVSEYNSKLWNSGIEANKDIVRKQKRRLHFISNIQVISDPSNPSNEGKVFLFKYGKKIFDKLKEAMEPQFADEEAVNPFDLWAGAPFKLKIRNLEGYRNYDKSEFGSPEPLSSDDKELEKIWKSEYSLQEFLAPSNFKSYEELAARLAKVLAEDSAVAKRSRAEEVEIEEDSAPSFKATHAPKYSGDEDDDESLEFFKNLAK
jgi:gp32 DNA binding protein like